MGKYPQVPGLPHKWNLLLSDTHFSNYVPISGFFCCLAHVFFTPISQKELLPMAGKRQQYCGDDGSSLSLPGIGIVVTKVRQRTQGHQARRVATLRKGGWEAMALKVYWTPHLTPGHASKGNTRISKRHLHFHVYCSTIYSGWDIELISRPLDRQVYKEMWHKYVCVCMYAHVCRLLGC